MLDPVSGEDAEAAVVHLNGQLHDRGAAVLLDDLDEARVELQALGRLFELEFGVLERVQLLLELGAHVHSGRVGHGVHLRSPWLDGAK